MKGPILLAVVVLLFSCNLFGQAAITELPEAPSIVAADIMRMPVAAPRNALASAPYTSAMVRATPILKTGTPTTRKDTPKLFDKKMMLLLAVTSAATVADLELTSRCLRANTCSETNPLFGRNPSRARMYGISIPLLGTQMAVSAWLRRRNPESKLWTIPMLSGTAAHGAGAFTTIGK